MKKKSLFTALALAALLGIGGLAGVFNEKNVGVAKADDPHVSTSLSTYFAQSSQTADSSGYKSLESTDIYALGDGSIVNMTAFSGGADRVAQVRDKGSNNYYIYLRYNSTHTKVGQLGNGIVFNAVEGYLLNSVNLYNSYQIGDAFQIEIFNQTTGQYVLEASDQMFSKSNATYSLTFSKPTTSFRITHYLHSTTAHALVAWKESSVFYQEANVLKFETNGGSKVLSQSFPKTTSETTFEPAAPTKPSSGTTKYTFAGWYTDQECTDGNEYTFGNVLSSNQIVYAKWTETQISGYTVTFNSNGGSAVASQTVEPNGTCTEPSAPTRSADDKYSYVFDAWYSDEELTTEYDFTSPVTQDIVLYAKYTSTPVAAPSNAVRYDLAAHAYAEDPSQDPYYWDNSAYSDSKNYFEINVDSYESFDKAKELPAINLTVTKLDKSGGINFQNTTYRNNPVIRMARMTISSLEEGKRIVFVRAVCDSYGSHADTMHLYANNSSDPSDTDEAPHNGGYSERLLQSTFTSTDNITSVTFAVGESSASYCQVKIRYVYIIYEDSSELLAARAYAQDFNDANVCGTDDETPVIDTLWSQQEQAYSQLDPSVRTFLATYEGSDADIVECLERYDRVVARRGASYDFMNRLASGRIVGPTYNPNSLTISSETMIPVIIVVTFTSVTLIAVGLLIRKRKNQ